MYLYMYIYIAILSGMGTDQLACPVVGHTSKRLLDAERDDKPTISPWIAFQQLGLGVYMLLRIPALFERIDHFTS